MSSLKFSCKIQILKVRVKVSYFIRNFENLLRLTTGEPWPRRPKTWCPQGVFRGKLSFKKMSAGGRLCTSQENPHFWVPTIKVRPPNGMCGLDFKTPCLEHVSFHQVPPRNRGHVTRVRSLVGEPAEDLPGLQAPVEVVARAGLQPGAPCRLDHPRRGPCFGAPRRVPVVEACPSRPGGLPVREAAREYQEGQTPVGLELIESNNHLSMIKFISRNLKDVTLELQFRPRFVFSFENKKGKSRVQLLRRCCG